MTGGIGSATLPIVLQLQGALQASPYAALASLLPQTGDRYELAASDVLMRITRGIALKDPQTAALLLPRVRYAESAAEEILQIRAGIDTSPSGDSNAHLKRSEGAVYQRLSNAWQAFAKEIEDASGRRPLTKYRPLVSLPALQKATRLLNERNAAAYDWIREGLTALQVLDPDRILRSKEFPLHAPAVVSLQLDRAEGDYYELATQRDSSRREENHSLELRISIPAERKRPLTEKELQLLVARCLALDDLFWGKEHPLLDTARRVPSKEISRPISWITCGRDGLRQYAPSPLKPSTARAWDRMGGWLQGTMRTMELVTKLKEPHTHAVRQFYLKEMDEDWAALLSIPNAGELFNRLLTSALKPYFMILFKIDDALGADFLVKQSGPPLIFHVRLGSKTLKELREEDLIDIVVRGSQRPPKPKKKDEKKEEPSLDLDLLRGARGLDEKGLQARDALRLANTFRKLMRRQIATDDPIGGDVSEAAQERFAKALAAVKAHHNLVQHDTVKIAWEDLAGIPHWHFVRGRAQGDSPIIDLIPDDKFTLVHVLGKSDDLTTLDWLYLLSLMAANPGSAFRIDLKNRNMLTGQARDAKTLYDGIAGNILFRAFDAHDPRAQLPAMFTGPAATAHPRYEKVPTEARVAYAKALRWFATSGIPLDFQPLATDTREQVQAKYRAMVHAWHADRGHAGETQSKLLSESVVHWRAISELYR